MMSVLKRTILVCALLIIKTNLFSQEEQIDYLGQQPPGYFPEVFAPEVFNATNIWGPVFSPDGTELFYTWQNPNGSQDYHIMYMRKTNGVWSDPMPAPFTDENGAAELEPNFTPDGNRLYYDSERRDGLGGADIWYVERTETGWSDPINAGEGINTSRNDNFPSFAEDGTMFFCSDRDKETWDIDIYYASYENGEFATPVRLHDSINSTTWEACPAVINDMLIYESYKSGGFGRGDLYVSHFQGDTFGIAERLSPAFNTSQSEFAVVLSPDKKYLFFKHGGDSTVQWVDVEILNYLGAKEAPFHYVSGWYGGNREQMAVALHPQLAKRQVTSANAVSSVSYSSMLSYTQSCYGCIADIREGRREISIMHEEGNIASAKLMSEQYYDYPQLVKFDGYWKVINVLWDYHSVTTEGDSASLITVLDKYAAGYDNTDSAEFAALFHNNYAGRLALSHTEVHSVSKTQFLNLQAGCSTCQMNNDFTYEVLDLYKNIATIVLTKGDSLEYLHLSFQDDSWYIVNALRNYNFDPERNYNQDTRMSFVINNNSLEELSPVGTEVGVLSLDVPSGNTIEYYLDDYADAVNNNDWFIIEGNIVKVNNLIEYAETNNCSISIMAIINDRDTICATKSIIIREAASTGMIEDNGITIYPNPAGGVITIKMDNISMPKVISISDSNGRIVTSKLQPFQSEESFDLSNLQKGIYSVSIDCAEGKKQETIVLE